MRKIILIGSGGSGKSTLARKLGNKLNITVYHLDTLFWKPNWISVDKNEQRKVQNELVSKKDWIIDGNYGGTMDIRIKAADTIIFLDLHRIICVFRVLKRILRYRNKTRPDMGLGCEEKFDYDFIKWVWNFQETTRPIIMEKLRKLSNEKQIIILKTPRQIRKFLDEV